VFSIIKKIINGRSGVSEQSDSKARIHLVAGVLLLEAAHVDNECTEEEMELVVATLRDKFNLAEECVTELLESAHRERADAIDLWQFTNHLNQHFSMDDKLAVMEDVWRVIHLDGRLEKHEDHFAHQLANLLRLNHQQLIETKLKARE